MPARTAIVVIGASAGGVEALLPLLSRVGERAPPIVVVIHLPRERPSLMAEIFGRACRATVAEAVDKAPLPPGTITFAPPDYHVLVERDGSLSLSVDDPVQYCRPSIDVLFESAAAVHGERVVAIVLTGNNEDGAAGAAAVLRAGGRVLVQDPASARGDAMPRAALAAAPGANACSLDDIGTFLQGLEWTGP